jgi:hypothetical protein
MLPLRTKLWHGPIVQLWYQLAKMPGQSCGSEVTSLMVNSNKRADVARRETNIAGGVLQQPKKEKQSPIEGKVRGWKPKDLSKGQS